MNLTALGPSHYVLKRITRIFLHRLRWIHLPGALLVALLQRTPIVRVVATAEQMFTASPLGAVLRSAITGIASLGAMHALAGATQFVYNPRNPPYTGTVGTTFPTVVFTITGAQTPPGSFRITNVPPGLTVAGLGTNGILNASSAVVSGVPTTAGTFTMTVLGYEFNDANGEAWPTTPQGQPQPQPITFTIAQGAFVAPAFTLQPAGASVDVGASVTLTSLATGSPTPTYQWRKNGTNILGATASIFPISNAQVSDSGDYSVAATNSAGSVTSNPANLQVKVAGATGRLGNLSVRTVMAAAQTLIVGVVVSDGSRDVLVRAAGPALAAFGLTNTMTDPRLDLFNGATLTFTNDDWPANLASIFSSVGAFGLATGSKDAAFLRTLNGANSIQARGTGAGVVLVEAYDTGAPTAARLVNVSARNRVGTGDEILIAGFNISGSGPMQLLIRAVGPKLGAFGVTGFLSDPKLEVFSSTGIKLTENDNWAATLAATFNAVGAFQLDVGSRDAALLTTLDPGSYTVQVRGADGGTGEALIEIYEVK
ncbi:MAG: hypothetical protein EXS37_02025 [Opitutus sp.]|nr:hypothetical protein [Opitutus sp.]